ncbi:MAG TPA: hypothetical protein VNA21_12010 [Steroidobacteraceae bacterium]|nr:hypothetical protein [Steroidobacteraceae bacterium]
MDFGESHPPLYFRLQELLEATESSRDLEDHPAEPSTLSRRPYRQTSDVNWYS